MRVLETLMQKSSKIIHSDFCKNVGRDMKSTRVTVLWLTITFYFLLVTYAIIHYSDSANTAITITGGLVSVVFTNYVFSKTTEKKLNNGKTNGHEKIPNDGD